jgi:hypothetical protein
MNTNTPQVMTIFGTYEYFVDTYKSMYSDLPKFAVKISDKMIWGTFDFISKKNSNNDYKVEEGWLFCSSKKLVREYLKFITEHMAGYGIHKNIILASNLNGKEITENDRFLHSQNHPSCSYIHRMY